MNKSNQNIPTAIGCLFFITAFVLIVGCVVGAISGDYDKGARAAQKLVIEGLGFIATVIAIFAFLALTGRRW